MPSLKSEGLRTVRGLDLPHVDMTQGKAPLASFAFYDEHSPKYEGLSASGLAGLI